VERFYIMLISFRVAAVSSVMLCFLAMPLSATPAHAENAMDGEPETPAAREEMERSAPTPPKPSQQAQQAEPEQTFEIYAFQLEGNTVYSSQRLLELLDDLIGPGKSAADVEKGRDILEKFYHDGGYPSVLVNIPEQKVEEGMIRLQVIESRISAIRVTGNRYFSTELILDKLPSLAPGTIIHVPDVETEIGKVNRNPDLKVTPTNMAMGKDPGTIEVDLKAEDKRPFHGSLEVDNRNSHDTTPLRLNLGAHYDNLWGIEHSLGVQYQFSPQKFDEAEVVSGSYTLPAPWDKDTSVVLYGVYSNSNTTTFSTDFNSIGKGTIFGTRYIIPLPEYNAFNHTAVLGFDYKHFNLNSGLTGAPAGLSSEPVEYMPLTITYSASLPDPFGTTMFNAAFNMAFRGLVTREQSFNDRRFKARANYFYTTLGLERRQKLPLGAGLGVKLDGQIADSPLISYEQFPAGGMESVRGYKESEDVGDDVFHGMIELTAPDLAPRFGLGERFQLIPYAFYDFAALWVKDPLAGQESAMDLQGAGAGIRGLLFRDVEFQTDLGFALSDTSQTKKGSAQVHFKLKYQF
jgi:hemolysin activation/secretion protein